MMTLGAGGRPETLKHPGGYHGVDSPQNMTTDSPLGPGTRVRILAPIGVNPFNCIAGQTNKQTNATTLIIV